MFSVLVIALTVLLSVSVLISAVWTGVPALSSGRSERAAVIELLRQAGLPTQATIVDLGSGWGSLVVALARAFPDACVQGVELSPLPYLVSRLRSRRLRNVSLRLGDFFRSDLQRADAVTCYLMPGAMPLLGDFLDRSVRQGTRVVSNTFLFRERTVTAIRPGAFRGTVALYVWPAHHWVVGDE